MNLGLLSACALLPIFVLLPARAQDESQVTTLLQKLKSEDIDTRHEAIMALQTSLDPRIPEACLPVLQKEGDSIRRLAARAIGSRWHQIPKERTADFVQALKPHLQSEHEGLANMARRGLALLGRDYKDAMVSRSKSKRWVVYERHRLPCVIDTSNSTEELLGFDPGGHGSFAPAWGNGEVAPATFWHPKQDMVALDIYTSRKTSAAWVWRPGSGLRQIHVPEIAKALGHPKEDIVLSAGFFVEIKGWKGASLAFTVSYAVRKGDDRTDNEAEFRWDSASEVITVLSRKQIE